MGLTDRQIRLFGAAALERDGSVEPIGRTAKALALLGYLAHQSAPIARVHLATLLWGETTDYRSRRNLTHVLGQLHNRLPGCLIADQHQVGWNADALFQVDVQTCARLLGAAHASRVRDGATQAEQLAQAVALYRGDLLADLTLSDSPEFDAWLMRTREHWHQQIAAALVTLSAHYAAHEIGRGHV